MGTASLTRAVGAGNVRAMFPDRRTFLRRALAAGVAAPLVGSLACRETPALDDGPGRPDAPTRPLVRAWSGDAVLLASPPEAPPVAYLSLRERRVYVDRSRRDRAERLLGAYVSVTTGFWRIPLPGDDPRVPITPGDEAREFEEVDLALRDPETTPAEGDVRVSLGRPGAVEVALACAPVLGGGGWVTAEPFVVVRLDGDEGVGGREYFGEVGRGRRHDGPACDQVGTPVRILSWAMRRSAAGGFPPER